MKYLKTYRLFESGEMITTESEEPSYNIDDLNDRFLELRDEGYFTDISTVHDKPLDFTKANFIHYDQMGNFTYGSPREMIEITITKKGTKSPITDADGNVISHRRRKGRFEIDEIKDTLESTISMVEMDGFEFDSYLVDDAVALDNRRRISDWRGYYNNIDDLIGLEIIKLCVYFIKKEDSVNESKSIDPAISDIWYILWNIIEDDSLGKFRFDITQTSSGNVIGLNKEYDSQGNSNYSFFFDPNKSADNGCPFHKAYHGTSPEFFEYHFKRKVGTKQGLIIQMSSMNGKLFDLRKVSDDLMQFKDMVESYGYKCSFYKDIKSIGTGFNKKKDIDIETSNPWVFRLAIVIKK